MMNSALKDAGLYEIYEKVNAGERLDAQDAETLYSTPHLPLLGFLADIVRQRFNGNKAYYIYNQHVNYSNVCINLCKFCAFGKEKAIRRHTKCPLKTSCKRSGNAKTNR